MSYKTFTLILTFVTIFSFTKAEDGSQSILGFLINDFDDQSAL